MAQNWIMIISELRRYQGVCYKSDITVISGRLLKCENENATKVLPQVLILVIDKFLSKSILAVIPHVCWTVLMEGEIPDCCELAQSQSVQICVRPSTYCWEIAHDSISPLLPSLSA